MPGFQGCPQGFQVAKDGFRAAAINDDEESGEQDKTAAAAAQGAQGEVLVCEACPPNMFQNVYAGEIKVYQCHFTRRCHAFVYVFVGRY